MLLLSLQVESQRSVEYRFLIMNSSALSGADAAIAAEAMRQVIVNNDTWEVLYWSPSPPGLWVMSYPDAHLHGGGPPRLEMVADDSLARRLKHIGWIACDPNAIVALLIERWCDRRALGALSCILKAWPNPGLTDGFGELRNALANVRASARNELDNLELELAHLAQNGIERMLDRT